MILSPTLVFGALLSTLYGALAHLLLGGGGKRLVAYVVAAWVGFAAGQAIGDVMHITALAVGPTNLLAATLGAVVAIAATAVLSGRGV